MSVNYAERAVQKEMLSKPMNWNRLNDKNKEAAEKFMETLANLQEAVHEGKILAHINVNGIAHKVELTHDVMKRN